MISTAVQLRLFDTSATEVGSFYKPGDWVKICKVPAIAKHVKCGHVYKVHEVESANGLLKFWNPFVCQWDYLYPKEVKLALAPSAVDSPTPAKVAVGEFIPHSETHTTIQLEAVGESIHPPEAVDSPTPAEVAVGESNCSRDEDYLALNAISTYQPRGTARGGKYFRLSYKDGGKVRTIHIRGGNTDSPIAQAKVAEVRSLLAAGISPLQIAAILREPGKTV
jgi:hypothetical protein